MILTYKNEARYDLDRQTAKISALCSNNLDKYEYLTGEDLGLKPSTIEQAKFEYSPIGKIFKNRLSKDDKKEGLFKRLINIENAQKTYLGMMIIKVFTTHLNQNLMINIKKQQTNIDTKPPNVFYYLKSLSQEPNHLMDEIEDENDDIDDGKLAFVGSNEEKFNFNTFNKPLNSISAIYNGKISLKEAEFKQRDLEIK